MNLRPRPGLPSPSASGPDVKIESGGRQSSVVAPPADVPSSRSISVSPSLSMPSSHTCFGSRAAGGFVPDPACATTNGRNCSCTCSGILARVQRRSGSSGTSVAADGRSSRRRPQVDPADALRDQLEHRVEVPRRHLRARRAAVVDRTRPHHRRCCSDTRAPALALRAGQPSLIAVAGGDIDHCVAVVVVLADEVLCRPPPASGRPDSRAAVVRDKPSWSSSTSELVL